MIKFLINTREKQEIPWSDPIGTAKLTNLLSQVSVSQTFFVESPSSLLSVGFSALSPSRCSLACEID